MGTPRSRALILAASPGEQAYAITGESTIFSQALLAALAGEGAQSPEDECDQWHVSVGSLLRFLGRRVDGVLAGTEAVQSVELAYLGRDMVIHRLGSPPDVSIVVNLNPTDAQPVPKARLSIGGIDAMVPIGNWPLEYRGRAGIYELNVDVDPPLTRRRAPVPGGAPTMCAASGGRVMDGYLQIDISASSRMLNRTLPFKVRNSDLVVVYQGKSADGEVALDPGTYAVDTVTATGEPRSTVVRIQPGSTTRVDLDSLEQSSVVESTDPDRVISTDTEIHLQPDPHEIGWQRLPPRQITSPQSETRAGSDSAFGERLEHTSASVFTVDKMHGCVVDRRSSRLAEILPPPHERPPSQPDKVATVTVSWTGRVITMSVPLNPKGSTDGARRCDLCVVDEAGGARLRMTFGPERVVSRAIEGLLRYRTATDSEEVFETSAELLLGKYSDPVGATLGALALHSMGRLRERRAWVSNLARDFPWIPDGQIVYAALLAQSDDIRVRESGLSLLVTACGHRPMYTDGLSLGMELLRHWPDPGLESARREALKHLANLAAAADWHSLNLTTYES